MIVVTLPSDADLRLQVIEPSNTLVLEEEPIKVELVLGVQGLPARADVIVNIPGPLTAGSVVWDWFVGNAQTFDPTKCKFRVRYAPTVTWQGILRKSVGGGAFFTWVTFTVLAGANIGTVVFADPDDTGVMEDDLVEFVPQVVDATVGSASFTLAES